MPTDYRQKTPDLPGATELPRAPQVIMPDSGDAVASRVADFGNIVQNFTGKASQQVGRQVDMQSKATEMVVKTNIDNSMRAFARRSLAMQNPKAGLASFQEQANDYITKLIDGGTGVNYQVIDAYANHAKDLQSTPLEKQVRTQGRIDAKAALLASFESNSKDISQIIKATPYEEAVNFHSFDKDRRDDALANSPTIAKAHYALSQTLNQIDGAVSAGLFTPTAGENLKKKIIKQSNDDMLTHAFHMALDKGQGQQFIESFASKMEGEDDFAYYADHMGKFKQIQNLFLTQHKISEEQAKADIQQNLNDIALGKDSNPFVDTLATAVAFLSPNYDVKKKLREFSGGVYKQLTAMPQSQAETQFASQLTKIDSAIANTKNQEAQERLTQTRDAIVMSGKNASKFFEEYNRDPIEQINKEGVLSDVAQSQALWKRAIAENKIPPNLRIPENDTLRGYVAYQVLHGAGYESVRILSNAQAIEKASQILSAAPIEAVAQIQNLQAQYGEFSANVFNDLVKHGKLPESYGILQGVNPLSPYLKEVVTSLKMPEGHYPKEQTASVKARVSKTLDFRANPAHPDAGFFSRLVGTSWESIKQGITGREYDPGQYSTGLFGGMEIFSDRSTTPDLRIKAYFESLESTAGFATNQMYNNGQETLEKMANYFVGTMGLSENEAMRRAADVLTGQYSFVAERDHTVRLPRNKTNFNDVSGLFNNTPELLNKIEWQFPGLDSDYTQASRANDIAYFKENIKNGHWATHPTDKGLIWVGASGTVPPMKNGNPLYVSFDSLQNFNLESSATGGWEVTAQRRPDETLKEITRRTNEADQYLSLFRANGVSFNEETLDIDPEIYPEHKRLKDSFSRFEMATNIGAQQFDAMVDRFYTNHAEAVRRKRVRKGGAK